MKKAKFLLVAIAILAIAGATMASRMRTGTPKLVVPQSISSIIFTHEGEPYTITFWTCSTTNVWRTNIGIPTSTWSSFTSTYTTLFPDGKEFTITFPACTTFFTATTIIN